MTILKIEQLSKKLGNKQVLNKVSFEVPENTILGFIGENGAGKTTTMKLILGLLKVDSGKIFVCGEPVCYGQNDTNRLIGYLPDVPEFYSYMTSYEYLMFCGRISGLTNQDCQRKVAELLTLVGLKKNQTKINGFSRGMKQRLGVAQALINEPKLLICDEPTSALDPIGRKDILELFIKIKSHTSVVFSTHILSDVDSICDQVILLRDGEIQFSSEITEFKKQTAPKPIRITFSKIEDLEEVKRKMMQFDNSYKLDIEHLNLTIESSKNQELLQYLFSVFLETKIFPLKIEEKSQTLDQLFKKQVKEGVS